MTNEASKTRAVRGTDFEKQYLSGRVIDIGCGNDPIVPHAEPFDLKHGDAEQIASLRPNGVYDAVCSSHCLEHMHDVPKALAQWWALVRDGGHLILVVPDEDLYEQGGWPSLFNRDHKATFRLGKASSWSPVSFEVLELIKSLDGIEVISCERHDRGYDYSLMRARLTRKDRALFSIQQKCHGFMRRTRLRSRVLTLTLDTLFLRLGAPVDQTAGDALAQIQIIVRKRLGISSGSR